jgi:plastocyanin
MFRKFLPVTVFALILISGAFALVATFQLANRYGDKVDETKRCEFVSKTHEMKINSQGISPDYLDANLCDKLTITNTSSKLRLVAFGEHEEHKSYDGISEEPLEKGESFQIELNRAGEFNFHDHLDESFVATFKVNEP